MKHLSSCWRRAGLLCLWALCGPLACADVEPPPSFGTVCTEQADCGEVLQCIQLTSDVRPACTAPCNSAIDCPPEMVCATTNQGSFCSPPGLFPIVGANNGANNGENNGEVNNGEANNGDTNNGQENNANNGQNNGEVNNGEVNNGENNQPGPCQGDEGCQSGLICVEGACVEGCRQDEGCGAGEVCQEARCVPDPGPGCGDGQEPNDSLEQARVLELGQRLEGLRICEADVDLFRFETQGAGAELRVELQFQHNSGDLEVALLDVAGDVVERADSQDDDELLTGALPGAGTWYLRVKGAGEQVINSYSLLLEVTEPQVGPDPERCQDSFEPNNSQGEASALIQGQWGDLHLCPGERDWYALPVQPQEELTVTMDFAPQSPNVEMELVSEDGVSILAPGLGRQGGRDLRWVSDRSGRVFLRVRGVLQGEQVATYALRVDRRLLDTEPDCVDDFDPNEEAQRAQEIRAGVYPNLSLCPQEDQEDWFAILLERRQRVTARALFSQADADLDMRLWRPGAQSVLSQSQSQTDNEEVSGEAQEDGLHLIQVSWRGGGPTSYNLAVTTEAPQPGPCEDLYEENNGPSQAPSLLPGFYDSLTLCGDAGDVEDWFRLGNLREGQTVRAHITFRSEASDIDMQLLGMDGMRQLDSSVGVGSQEEVEAEINASGTYFLRIYTNLGERNPYTLELEVTGGSDDPICNDRYEPNGDRGSAAPLEVPGDYMGLGLCSGFDTEDWYALDLEAGQQVQIQVTFTDSVSDIDAQLLRPGSGWLDWAQSYSDDETLEAVVEDSGVHFLRVYTRIGDPNPYDLSLSVE